MVVPIIWVSKSYYYCNLHSLCNYHCHIFRNKFILILILIPPPTELRYTGSWLAVFQPVTTIEVHKLILSTPNKSCDLDPIPTTLVKQCCAELLPIITNTINGSLMSGVFPSDYKVALVRPIIKKSNYQDKTEWLIFNGGAISKNVTLINCR